MTAVCTALTIVTHNAYWFQGWPSLWGEERRAPHPDILEALVNLYGSLHPDVLCLQEVPSHDLFTILQARLGMSGAYAPGGILAAYGGAILIRDSDASVTDCSRCAVVSGRVFERVCIRANCRGLNLVNIHLSSDRYAPRGHGEPTRLAEIEILFRTGSKPHVIAGDFNATSDSVVHQRMRDHRYTDAGRSSPERFTVGTGRVDYIWLSEEYSDSLLDYQVIGGQASHCGDTDPFVELSDHWPVLVRLDLTGRHS
jgi:endonuclease/exonuclease/phosphatase family metal-dependent hydrolase